MNSVAKLLFTCQTYTFYLANLITTECLELVNFPWFLLYTLSTRFFIIADSTTFLCTSLAKVILNWRIDYYVKLNSNITVNIATISVICLILVDLIIRINIVVFGGCRDETSLKCYQAEFKREFCVPELNNSTVGNMTLCEAYDQADNVYPIGCQGCASYPTMRIIMAAILLFETIKFLLGFFRIMKKYGKKINNVRKGKVSSSTAESNTTAMTNSKNQKISNPSEKISASKENSFVSTGFQEKELTFKIKENNEETKNNFDDIEATDKSNVLPQHKDSSDILDIFQDSIAVIEEDTIESNEVNIQSCPITIRKIEHQSNIKKNNNKQVITEKAYDITASGSNTKGNKNR